MPPEPLELGTPIKVRYNTPAASSEWFERSADVQDMTMDISGFLGIQFYDFEAYFAGDVTNAEFEAVYSTSTTPSSNMLSGAPSKRYDAENNVTIVSGRCNMPPFEEGTNANVVCMGENNSNIWLRP